MAAPVTVWKAVHVECACVYICATTHKDKQMVHFSVTYEAGPPATACNIRTITDYMCVTDILPSQHT